MLDERDLQAIEIIVDDKIGAKIKESEDRTDARFKDFEATVDARFEDFEARVDARFKEMEERILQESAHNMRVILESSIDKKLDLILEALSGHQARIEQLEKNAAEMDALSDEVQVLKSVVRAHSERMDGIEKRLA